jgi:hypothetical protein
MKGVSLLAALVFVIGCSDTNEDSFENFLSGYYKVVSIEGDTSIDMDNDGKKSSNVYQEISGPHATIDGMNVSFFDFNSIANYMEIRPLEYTTNDAKLISVNFPDQHIGELTNGERYLMFYTKGFINYSYTFNEGDKRIGLINNNPSYIEDGTLISLESLTGSKLKLTLTKKAFDFSEEEWIEVRMTVMYQKVEN